MINTLEIKNFKCLEDESFDLGKLNVITGVNSSGKSSVIQAILLFVDAAYSKMSGNDLRYYSFEIIRNRYQRAEEIQIKVNESSCEIRLGEKYIFNGSFNEIKKNENLFYLKETRIGPKNMVPHSESNELEDNAEFVLSYLYKNQTKKIAPKLIQADFDTLSQNVDYWLQRLFDRNVELKVEKTSDPKTLGVLFNFDELERILPTQLGAGLTYATEIIVTCLQAKPGQMVIIENPEIHLHPAAQSKLGEFLSFVAAAGVQVIIETHCEHLINRIRYEVYSHKLSSDDVKIFYKEDCRTPFYKMTVAEDGHFMKDGVQVDFPSGFFDATLDFLCRMSDNG